MWETTVNEGEEGHASGARAQIPMQTACAEPGFHTAAHGGPWGSRYPPCRACMSRWICSEGSSSSWKAHAEGGAWQELWAVEREAHGGAWLLAGPVMLQGTHAGVVCSWKTLPCRTDPHWRNLWMGGAPCWSRSTTWWRSSSHKTFWIDHNTHLPSVQGVGGRRIGGKVNLRSTVGNGN